MNNLNIDINNTYQDNTQVNILPQDKVIKYKQCQIEKCIQIKKSIDISSKNKAVLSLKYDNIAFKINCIQISVIIVSSLITFIETLNALYNLNEFAASIIPIILAIYIAVILSIMRFFKLDESKENIGKTLENFSYIINKSRKSKHKIKNFDINQSNLELWENLISNYENEIYEYLLNVRESFENILHYKELVYFKRRLLNHYVKNAFACKNITYVDKHFEKQHRDYEENLSTCDKLQRYFCCDKRNQIFYDYLNHLEQLEFGLINKRYINELVNVTSL